MGSDPYPKSWKWSAEAHPKRLSEWVTAPDRAGFYELGFMKGQFAPMYCGRAAGVTLRARLRQHYLRSHNANVRKYSNDLWYRYKVFDTFELAAFVEAVHIAAFQYEWNNRNEWAKHWALET